MIDSQACHSPQRADNPGRPALFCIEEGNHGRLTHVLFLMKKKYARRNQIIASARAYIFIISFGES